MESLANSPRNTEARVKRKFTSSAKLRARDQMIAHEVLVNEVAQVEVARRFGISKQAIHQVLQRVKQDYELIDKYNAQKADIQAHNQMRRQVIQDTVLDSLTEGELKKADLKTKMVVLNTLGMDKTREFEAERLVRGQSTDNVAIIVQAWKDIKKKRKEVQDSPASPQ